MCVNAQGCVPWVGSGGMLGICCFRTSLPNHFAKLLPVAPRPSRAAMGLGLTALFSPPGDKGPVMPSETQNNKHESLKKNT